MPFQIVRNDITKMRVDAIVNAANPLLQEGGGVCGAIFRAAGPEELPRECDAIGGCKTGQAVITRGYGLPAPYIIHTVGPVWRGGDQKEAEQLTACYQNSLVLAKEKGLDSLAFPLISAGVYGYPRAQALAVATGAITRFLTANDLQVYLVMFDKEPFPLGEKLLRPLRAFIDRHITAEYAVFHNCYKLPTSLSNIKEKAGAPFSPRDLVARLDESFSQTLLRLIDAKGLTDVEVYKRANLDRKLFSKIRSKKDYRPSKKTAAALALALKLDLGETRDLLDRAGYSLSRSQLFDLVIEYFITEGIYDIYAINEALFYFDQPLLGG